MNANGGYARPMRNGRLKFSKSQRDVFLATFDKEIDRLIPSLTDPITVTKYVESKRILPQGTPFPGLVDMELTPYLKEIQDNFSIHSATKEVAFMKSSQIGATFVVENIIVYSIGHSPCPILYTSANQALLEKWSNKRLDPAIASCGLNSRIFLQVEKKGSKRLGDKILSKEFAGGSLDMASMQSAPSLRSDSIKLLIMDELDGAPIFLKKEGDPRSIAEARTQAWGDRKKILYISTPTTTEESKIYDLYLQGDQRKYFVPCPFCNFFQVLQWINIKFDRDKNGYLKKDSVRYQCDKCKKRINEHHKKQLLKKGEWRPTKKAKKRGLKSYHISSLYTPPGMDGWEALTEKFLEAKDNPIKLRAFTNLVWGEPYFERGEAPSYEKVIAKRGGYKSGSIPEEFLCMTLGVDVQKDRIECEAVAWGINKRSWSIKYFVFESENKDVEIDDFDKGCWGDLKSLLIEGVSKTPIDLTFIDSGYATSKVYEFCAKFSSGVYPIMGEGRSKYKRKNVITPRKVLEHNITRYDLNTDMLKDELASYLRKEQSIGKGSFPAGYCHFPQDYPDEYFKQLTAEDKILKTDTHGNKYYIWLNRKNRANEALDTRCYNLAALYLFASLVCADIDPDSDGNISWSHFWQYLQEN